MNLSESERKDYSLWTESVFEILAQKTGKEPHKLRYAPTLETGVVALDMYVAYSWGVKPEVVAAMLETFMRFKSPWMHGEPRTPYWYQMR